MSPAREPESVALSATGASIGTGSFATNTPRGDFYRALVLPLALVAVWELSTRYGLVNTRLLVPPTLVVQRALAEFREGALFSQLAASLVRDLGGAALGSAFGVLVGSVMGVSRIGERLLGPSFHAAKQVAIFAWIPLMSVWLGTGETAKVVFIALAAFYPVAVNTFEGIRSVAPAHVEVAKVFRYSRLQVFRRVVLPAAAPSIFTGVKVGLVYAWLGTIGAEYLLAAGPGIGNLMIDGRESFQMDKVLLGVIVVGAVGFTISAAASALETKILGWRALRA
jgi:sulfonate transport system permease protein